MDYIQEAQEALAEFTLKGKILNVEAKYSGIIQKVELSDAKLIVTLRDKPDTPYEYADKTGKLFKTFASYYSKIKADPTNRDKYSLGKYYNMHIRA